MLSFDERRNYIARFAAETALKLPFEESGFWFHKDLRDNFYFASHLFAYCIDPDFDCSWDPIKREQAKKLALNMIGKTLEMQVTDPDDPMYGHFPLRLATEPEKVKPNKLPIELMGCLFVLFYQKYKKDLPEPYKGQLFTAIEHIYKGKFYDQPLNRVHHHEAKHTSLKLLLGYFFKDHALFEKGYEYAKRQLAHIQKFGFKEYGILPWFWHWIQSFTSVWEVVKDKRIRSVVTEILEYLWNLRADYYLQGTWVGPQQRSLAHDAPRDRNVLFDYLQFGDFPEPTEIVRLEGTALFTYQVPEKIVKRALDKKNIELKQTIQVANIDGIVLDTLNTYTYKTKDFALGGIWERREEFDNEQRRWDLTLPLTKSNQNSVNQGFFFHPGKKYRPGDDRHESDFSEVYLGKNFVLQLWHVTEAEEETYPDIIGCLPLGEWLLVGKSGYGKVENIYISFQLMNEFSMRQLDDRISISSPLKENWNGLLFEVMPFSEAEKHGINNLTDFANYVQEKNKDCFEVTFRNDEVIHQVELSYTDFDKKSIYFSLDHSGKILRKSEDVFVK